MINLECLSYLLIFIGILNISIIYYMKNKINKVVNLLTQATLLNQDLEYDVEKFLENIGSILKILDINNYGYEFTFMNNIIKSKELKTTSCKKIISNNICTYNYKVLFKFCPSYYKDEQKDKFDLILNMISMIIKQDLEIKKESINKSFSNISQYHTFILHDIKNISQFFHTLEFNINQCKTQEDKIRLFEYLKSSNHLLDNKSSKIVKLLEQNSTELELDSKVDINLKLFILDIINIYQLKANIEGNSTIYQNKDLMQWVFDNIIKNISDKMKKQKDIKVDITISKDDKYTIVSILDSGEHIKDINKIFEPFYTTKDTGLGIGLYKVKTLLNSIDAILDVSNLSNGVEFKIKFKNNKDK